MPNLSQIISKKERIVKLIQQFGFNNDVKIKVEKLAETEEFKLVFVIKQEKQVSYKNAFWLRAKLAEELSCEVNITVYENVNKLYQYDLDEKSAAIADKETLLKLFGKTALEDIYFICLKTESELVLQKALLEQANNYLAQSNIQSSAGFSAEQYNNHGLRRQ